MGMRIGLFLLACASAPGRPMAANGDPQEVWEQAVKAKGGRDRLHNVHSLAVYMKPADVNLAGPPTNWLCVFPDRYFEFEGRGSSARAVVVDGTADRTATDATGIPRNARHLTPYEHDRLALNQLIFLLESAWLHPQPVEVRHAVLVIQADGRSYKVFLNKDSLPERILSLPTSSEKHGNKYDYRLQRYREFQGVMLPGRVVLLGNVSEYTWDVDYEVDAKYNPKLFERMPDLANGPEPWRMK
jgi:hypothetical protein